MGARGNLIKDVRATIIKICCFIDQCKLGLVALLLVLLISMLSLLVVVLSIILLGILVLLVLLPIILLGILLEGLGPLSSPFPIILLCVLA